MNNLKSFLVWSLITSLSLFFNNAYSTTVVVPMYEDSLQKTEFMITGNVLSGKSCQSPSICRAGEIEYYIASKYSIFGSRLPNKIKIKSSQQLCIGCEYIFLLKMDSRKENIEQHGIALEVVYDIQTKKKEVLFYKERPSVNQNLYEYKKDIACTSQKHCTEVIRYRYVPFERFIGYILSEKKKT
jgi:hypothetical protein